MQTNPQANPMSPLLSPYKNDKQARRRKEIMDAAAAVFAEKGYFTATIQDIADKLGMRAGSLYYYFSSKEAALEEICRRGAGSFNVYLEHMLATDVSAPDMVRAGIQHHLSSEARHYTTNFAFQRRNLPANILPEMNALARAYYILWERVFRRGIERGELPHELNCKRAAVAAVSFCNGAVLSLAGKSAKELDDTGAYFADLFLKGVLPRT